MRDQIAFDLRGVDEIGHAEMRRHLDLVGVEIDADDLVGARQPQALDDVEPDAAQAEDHRASPISTLAVLITAPMPVVTPQPM